MEEEEGSGGGIFGLLRRKVGPAPVWVYVLIGVLGLAWYLRSKGSSSSSGTTATSGSSVTASTQNGGAFPSAYPMNYSSDVYLQSSQATGNSNSGTSTGDTWYYTVPQSGGPQSWYDLAKLAFPKASPSAWGLEAQVLQAKNGGQSSPTPQPGQQVQIGSSLDWLLAGYS